MSVDAGDVPGWAREWLSDPRLVPYLRADGDPLALYAWNSRLSAVMFELVGWFEVCWRNTVDRAITTHRSPTAPHWVFDPQFPLQPASRQRLRQAIAAAQRGESAPPPPGKVIAELSLGFWRFTTRGYRQTIWPYLGRTAFPAAPGRPHQRHIDRRLVPIIRLRNRIAHHEPIFALPVRQTAGDLLLLGSWINPDAASWWREHTAVFDILDARPQ